MNSKDVKITNLNEMIDDAARLFGISKRLLKSESRLQDVIEARAMLYQYLNRKGYSITLIAKAFHKNYDTISHALKKWDVYTNGNTILKTRYEIFVGKYK